MPSFRSSAPRTLFGAALVFVIFAAASPFSAAAQETPTADEIVARHVEARGGEDAIRAHTSMTARGTFDWPAMGVSGEFILYAMAPDKYLSRLVLPELGEIVEACNGEVCWTDNPDGAQLVDGEMLADLKRRTRFHAELEYADLYPQRKTVGETEWDAQAAWRVDLVDTEGKDHSHYFSSSTGLLIGVEATMTSDVGIPTKVAISSSDYKDFGGLVWPTSVTTKTMGMEMHQAVDTVTWNDVHASAFEAPDAIRSLPEE